MRHAPNRRSQASAAAAALGRRLGVACDDARVISDSNNTIVHLAPAPLVAKVGTSTIRPEPASLLAKELEIGIHLAERGAPVAPPAKEVAPGPYLEDDFAITLWTFIQPLGDGDLSDAALGEMLKGFHRGLADYRKREALPDFSEDLTRARRALEDGATAPRLPSSDRAFLLGVASGIADALQNAAFERHPLHGDPHLDGNVLLSDRGPLLIDFEGACVGPYEWDLTSLGRASAAYPDLDRDLLTLLSRMRSMSVSTWCWMQYGRVPEVDEAAHFHLETLRGGHA